MSISPPPAPPKVPGAAQPVALAAVTALVLTIVPWLTALNFPFRMLVTIVHELGHGLTALLTGGAFARFVVFPDGSGVAYTAGGIRLLVIPAGYLASALFGAALVMLGRHPNGARRAALVIGALVPLLTLRYGVPSLFSTPGPAAITVLSGLAIGAIFLYVGLRASAPWVVFLLNLVAFQSALFAAGDLMTLIGLNASFSTTISNDAASMAQLTYIPAVIWAVLWAVTAAVMMGYALWRTWGGARNEPNKER